MALSVPLQWIDLGTPEFGLVMNGAGIGCAVCGLHMVLSQRLARGLAAPAVWGVLASLVSFAWWQWIAWQRPTSLWTAFPMGVALAAGAVLLLRMARVVTGAGFSKAGNSLHRSAQLWAWIYGAYLVTFLLFGSKPESAAGLVRALPFLPCVLIALILVPGLTLMSAATQLIRASKDRDGVCGNCGFSLAGLRDPVCPECGKPCGVSLAAADPSLLSPAKPVWRGVLSVWLVVIVATAAAFLQLPGDRFVTHKPFWLLMRDAIATTAKPDWVQGFMGGRPQWRSRHPEGPALYSTRGADAAQKELVARIGAGTLSQGQLERLARAALDIEGDPALPMGAWAEIFEAVDAAGAVSVENRRRYMLSMMQFGVICPDRIRAGVVLPMNVEGLWRDSPNGPRVFNWSIVHYLQVSFGEVTIDGVNAEPSPPAAARPRQSGGDWTLWDFERFALSAPGTMPVVPDRPGKRLMVGKLIIKANECDAAFNLPKGTLMAKGLPAQWEVPFSKEVEVLPSASVFAPPTVTDPATGKELASQLDVSAHRMDWMPDGSVSIVGRVGQNYSLPCDLVVDVLVGPPDQERYLGTSVLHKSRVVDSSWHTLTPALQEELKITEGGKLRVVLRPNPSAAERALDTTVVWSGPDIVREVDFVVDRPPWRSGTQQK